MILNKNVAMNFIWFYVAGRDDFGHLLRTTRSNYYLNRVKSWKSFYGKHANEIYIQDWAPTLLRILKRNYEQE